MCAQQYNFCKFLVTLHWKGSKYNSHVLFLSPRFIAMCEVTLILKWVLSIYYIQWIAINQVCIVADSQTKPNPTHQRGCVTDSAWKSPVLAAAGRQAGRQQLHLSPGGLPYTSGRRCLTCCRLFNCPCAALLLKKIQLKITVLRIQKLLVCHFNLGLVLMTVCSSI